MGEKLLYYGRVRKALVFGSELKAIRAFPGFDNAIERQALVLYMRHNYVPAPWSIYQNIWKLPPGCLVQFSLRENRIAPDGRGAVHSYWFLREVAEYTASLNEWTLSRLSGKGHHIRRRRCPDDRAQVDGGGATGHGLGRDQGAQARG
jgi:asparagine synthetase B (glutamine-hydrolysing)